MPLDNPELRAHQAINRLDDPWTPEERRLAADLLTQLTATSTPITDPALLARHCLDAARALLTTRHRRSPSR